MKTVLVTYATMAGSTAEVANTIGEELKAKGLQVKVLPLEKTADLAAYDAIVLGAPMIREWHRSALRFLRTHRKEFEHIPVAVFALAMSLCSSGETVVNGVPLFADPESTKPPRIMGRPNFRERYAHVTRYAGPILKAACPARPVSVAFFGGRLDYFRLKLPARLFVMLAVQAQPGDRRNWQFIRSWANNLPAQFELTTEGHYPMRWKV